jgi:Cation/multidrug efflux pump
LPLSAIPTFWAMSALGFSLNLVTLLAITLVTGILVDDAIVEVENIVRHMRMGKSAYRASLEAADEIGLAVIAISMTIVAVFAPVSFMGGIAGQYFRQFGLTVSVAVLFSLLVARLITPVVAAYFMRSHETPSEATARCCAPTPGWWAGRYATAGSRWSPASRCSSARLRPPSCCLRASSRLRTSPALCSRSNCRRARGSRIPTR